MASRFPAESEPGRVTTPRGARLRAWRRIAAVALILLIHLPLHGLWRLFGLRSPWPRSFLRLTTVAAGIDVRMRGRPVRRNVLYAANHLTWFDIPIVAGLTGARFISKDDVAHWPWVGWLAKMNRTVFIARAERGQVAQQADQLRVALAEGRPVTLFPEGGTGDGVALRPFRASLFSALAGGGSTAQVQPVAIDYTDERRLVAWTELKGDFGAELFRLMGLPGRRRVTLTFCPPLDAAAMRDRKTMAAAAQAAVAEALGLRVPAPV